MMLVEIDFCTPVDLDEIDRIERACFEQPWPRMIIARDLEEGMALYLKAVTRKGVAGFAAMRKEGSILHLMNIAVSDEYRRLGIGGQLLMAASEIGVDQNCACMRLEMRSHQEHLMDFYRRFGLVKRSRMRNYYRNGDEAFVLVGRLPLEPKETEGQ